ncbi:MAG: hypothetical protein EAZ71_09930 [Verrucomicrobia bacterium]|nr:MAG: hypothetical protein EAZ82_09705 [Verrucomicrobiota bacterium]TAF24684.1 MAG: hypothetical protein EAZ71_09930 [Verrucomicrobiota bacterium]
MGGSVAVHLRRPSKPTASRHSYGRRHLALTPDPWLIITICHMKTPTLLSIFALVLAALALVLSIQNREPMDPAKIELAADQALRKREKEFVEELRPQFQRMFAEMSGDIDKTWNPQTIGELIDPLTKIINEVSGE